MSELFDLTTCTIPQLEREAKKNPQRVVEAAWILAQEVKSLRQEVDALKKKLEPFKALARSIIGS